VPYHIKKYFLSLAHRRSFLWRSVELSLSFNDLSASDAAAALDKDRFSIVFSIGFFSDIMYFFEFSPRVCRF